MENSTVAELKKLLENSAKEIQYYKNRAMKAGNKRLQETEELSRLISRLRQTEKALEKARDKLEKRVQERTAELLETNKLLTQEISERKKAALELEESERKYKTLFED